MLYIIAAQHKKYRTEALREIQETIGITDTIILDDTVATLSDIEGYMYPSLFTVTNPIVHSKFLIEGGDIDAIFIKKCVASPTIFIFEEFAIPASSVTILKKHGAIVSIEDKKNTEKTFSKKPDLFAVTGALTAPSKKDRWLIYQAALQEHPPEALLGILYWKVRDLVIKGRDAQKWKVVYSKLLNAHAHAWQNGSPLALAIEKVILTN